MKYRKKPVTIEAVKWRGDNWPEVFKFINAPEGNMENYAQRPDGTLGIVTLEGTMTANVGDWVIRGVKGELYPCKPDIFEATYDAVHDA